MKKQSTKLPWFFALLLLLSAACGNDDDGMDTEGSPNDPDDYEEGRYMTNSAWVMDHLEDSDLKILDARSADAYEDGHIEGARNVMWQQFANVSVKPGQVGFGVVLQPTELSAALAAVDIEADDTIVVVADPLNGWGDDGRIVWMLNYAGITDAKMLDGGYTAWLAAGGEESTDVPTAAESSLTVDSLDPAYVANTQWILDNMKTAKIIDARTLEEFEGAQNWNEARGGHLPGAINLPFTSTMDDEGYFKTQKELETLFSEAGLDKGDEIVAYCTAGIRSAHLALVLRMAGYSKARNYDESFYHWAAQEKLPLE